MIKALWSRRFNRHKPYRAEDIDEDKLAFVMLWGALGKSAADGRDLETIRFIKAFKEGIEAPLGRAIVMDVLLADAHAMVNSLEGPCTNSYLQEVQRMLEEHGFGTVYLSRLWEGWGLSLDLVREEGFGIRDERLLRQLKKASSRYSRRGQDSGYKRYYAARMLEKKHLEDEFAGRILLTFNSPIFREILPDLPTLHIRSRRGSSAPPWIPNHCIS